MATVICDRPTSMASWLHLCAVLHGHDTCYLSKLFKIRQIQVIYPHFEKVRGSVEPWLMARWKARVEFLLSVIELLSLCLTVEALQGKMCQNSLPSRGRSLGNQKFQGEGVVPPQIY